MIKLIRAIIEVYTLNACDPVLWGSTILFLSICAFMLVWAISLL